MGSGVIFLEGKIYSTYGCLFFAKIEIEEVESARKLRLTSEFVSLRYSRQMNIDVTPLAKNKKYVPNEGPNNFSCCNAARLRLRSANQIWQISAHNLKIFICKFINVGNFFEEPFFKGCDENQLNSSHEIEI